MVSAKSEYGNAKALLEAIKAGGKGAMKGSGTGQGGIWHLGLAGWLMSEDRMGAEPGRRIRDHRHGRAASTSSRPRSPRAAR